MTITARELSKAELRTLADEIAAELTTETGDTWTAQDEHPEYPGLHLTRGTDGARLHFRQGGSYQDRARLIASLSEPAAVTAHNNSSDASSRAYTKNERATYATDRPARAIARDLARRLLPVLTEETARVIAEAGRHANHRAATERNARELAAATGGRAYENRDGITGDVHLPGTVGRLEVRGDRVRLERLASVTVDQARRIAAILAETAEA